MKKLTLLLLWSLLVCNPYPYSNPITDVQISYVLSGATVTDTGTYTVSGSNIQLYDFGGPISGISQIQARWSDGALWSSWIYPTGSANGFWF